MKNNNTVDSFCMGTTFRGFMKNDYFVDTLIRASALSKKGVLFAPSKKCKKSEFSPSIQIFSVKVKPALAPYQVHRPIAPVLKYP